MSHQQEDDAEHLGEENTMKDAEDDTDIQSTNREKYDVDSDEDNISFRKLLDTTAAQARRGKDIQGIPWDRLGISRERYRQTRFEEYKNYESIPHSGDMLGKVTNKGYSFYEFRRNSRSVKPTILHFQLRNLVWATSKHDAYFMSNFSVVHWSSLTCTRSKILNVSGHVAPSEHIDQPGVSFCTRTCYDDNTITNAIEIYASPNGAVHFTVSNNDCGIRDFDAEKFQLSKHFCFPWPVNHTSLSRDDKLLLVVGDNTESMLVDSQNGKVVAALSGHLDFSFASSWNPDGVTFATGNQDKTCRISTSVEGKPWSHSFNQVYF